MENKINTREKAILNLQRYYEDCLNSLKTSNSQSFVIEILNEVFENNIKQSNVLFVIIYENEGRLICMNGTGPEFEIPKLAACPKEECVQQFFNKEDTSQEKHVSYSYFRYIGAWLNEDNKIQGKIYYMLRLYGFDDVQAVYLNSLEEAYYEWTRKKILQVANANIKEYQKIGTEHEHVKNSIIKKAEAIFEDKMLNIYGINLNIITDISGSYYEGCKCNSTLAFKIGKQKTNGIFFSKEDCVEIKKENIRNLRKKLEMCQKGQCILAEKGTDLKWEATGLCRKISGTNDILFEISDHMFWEMKIGNRPAVCYKYGKYIIRQPRTKIDEFRQIYKKVFHKDANEYLNIVFEKAAAQSHGTSVIILDNSKQNSDIRVEVNRLLKKSSGIAIEPEIHIPKEFIVGVTSIDGAVIMNKSGKCYAIGAILDGTAAIKGDRAHGARHNSVMKYIKTKYAENMQGIGIIFSEDKTIQLISTEDNWEEPEDGCK